MQNFINQRFPSQISFGIEFGPEFQTEIVETSAGKEYRNAVNYQQRRKYYLAASLQSQEEVEVINRFFQLTKGKLKSFRFYDILDNHLDQEKVATGDGVTKKFQLNKTYYYCGQKLYNKKIVSPLEDTLQIWIDKAKCNTYKILDGGIIEFITPPEKNYLIRASCNFDVIVRFDNDYLPITFEQPDLFKIEGLKLVEIFI